MLVESSYLRDENPICGCQFVSHRLALSITMEAQPAALFDLSWPIVRRTSFPRLTVVKKLGLFCPFLPDVAGSSASDDARQIH